MGLAMLEGGKKFFAELNKIAKASEWLEVGFFPQSVYPNGIYVAQVANWQEYGTYTAPPRPFFRTCIQNNSSSYGLVFATYLKNHDYDIDMSFKYLGNKVKYDLQASIEDWSTPPNAPITIEGGWMKNKKSGKVFYVEGKGFDDPLVTDPDKKGLLYQAVRWKYKDELA